MDSFFSLFDPAETNGGKQTNTKKKSKVDNDNVKKKSDAPKGRRRGRKGTGKHETLPEESSFLCEPNLSTELLVKDVSYIENFIEISKKDDDTLSDDRKPKRRNSNRKTRRKKSKASPPKDTEVERSKDGNLTKPVQGLNNQTGHVSRSFDTDKNGNVGKNVNKLSDDAGDVRRNAGGASQQIREDIYAGNEVHYVIDKLEKVSLKDDAYLAGDFDTRDLDEEAFCSDYDDDFIDADTSEPEDSADETYGSLPPEPRFGNVEYKLQLVALCERRFQHLVTQLKWRLRSGGGACVYVVGVRDCGALVGLRPRPLRASLRELRRMARALGASLARVTARRVAPNRAVAEVTVRKVADPQQSVELRVAVMGANEAGKSTLLGVLTQGELDNGRGSARLNMFRHLHEVKSGRTSSLSHEILGFDAQGNVVNYGCSELMTAERIGERSAKLVSFLDLAGHSKYQKTTVHGLTGYSPHYAMLVISATAGVTKITEEHIDLLLALALPFFVVITKCEVASTQIHHILARVEGMLVQANKKPLLITDENLAKTCVEPQKLILDSVDDPEPQEVEDDRSEMERVPVFPVSCVKGVGLSSLHAYLLALQPPPVGVQTKPEDETCEFQIDEIFHVDEARGPVVGGLLVKGTLSEGDTLLMGPLECGSFALVRARSVFRNRVAVARALRGHCASVGLRLLAPAPQPRPGMVLLAVPQTMMEEKDAVVDDDVLEASIADSKNSNMVNANLLRDIANVEQCLTKDTRADMENNIFKGEAGDDGQKRSQGDVLLLEDPNNPRGCIFFQAKVHVLRHATAIYPGFQCTVHVANVRQTAIIEGIMSHKSLLRAGECASVLFRFVRCPEYLVRGRRMLFTAGLGTRAIGRITQTFPFAP